MSKVKLAGRVLVFGPAFPSMVAGIVTRVHEDGTIDATAFPPGSTTGLCVHAIGPLPAPGVKPDPGFYYTPAEPEPVALTIGVNEFVNALKPIVAGAVEDYANQEDADGSKGA